MEIVREAMNQFQEGHIAVMARVILFTGERLGLEVVQEIPPALDGLISERDALRVALGQSGDLKNELQQRLTAADERVAVLETALRNLKVAWVSSPMSITSPEYQGARDALDGIALKPAEGGGDEA